MRNDNELNPETRGPSSYQRAIKGLKHLGIHLLDDVQEEHAWNHLHTALHCLDKAGKLGVHGVRRTNGLVIMSQQAAIDDLVSMGYAPKSTELSTQPAGASGRLASHGAVSELVAMGELATKRDILDE